MIRIIGTAISICLSLLLPTDVLARTLSVSAGEIASGIEVGPEDVELSLVGTVNAADLHRIALNCRSLQSLDLSKVDIVAYSGEAVVTNRGDFPADELPAYSLSGLTASSIALPQSLRSIGDGALMSSSIENIVIPESVDKIGVGSFAGCGRLGKVVVASTVKNIGAYSFKGCGSLTEVEYNSSVVPESAFSDCAKLSNVSLGSGVEFIGKDAFAGCVSLSEVYIVGQASLSGIGDGAFASTAVREMDFSDCRSLKTIGAHTFARCTGLESIILPSSVECMGEGAFLDCSSLRDMVFPERISTIPAMTFKGAGSMSDLSGVMSHVSEIGDLAMAGMTSVGELHLPVSLHKIGSNAFEGCTALGIILAEKLGSVPALGPDVWLGLDCPSVELVVDRDMASGFSSADQWKDFKIKIFDESAIDSPVADRNTDAIRACLHESVIELSSPQPIAGVSVYDLDGRRIFYAGPLGVCSYSASVAAVTGKVYILSVSMADGSVAAVKLLNSND